jgi:hypothetical protein
MLQPLLVLQVTVLSRQIMAQFGTQVELACPVTVPTQLFTPDAVVVPKTGSQVAMYEPLNETVSPGAKDGTNDGVSGVPVLSVTLMF